MAGPKKVVQSEFMSSLGTFVVAWGQLEAIIDIIINEIYDKHNGATYKEKKPTVGFKRKVKFLRKWARNSSFAKSNFPWLEAHIDETVKVARPRNNIAHGIYTNATRMQKIANIKEATFTAKKKDGGVYTEIFSKDRLDDLILLTLYLGEVWRSLMLIVEDEGIAMKPQRLEDGLDKVASEIAALYSFKATIIQRGI